MKTYDKQFLQKLQQRDDAAFTELYNDTVDTFFRYLKTSYFLSDGEINDIISTFYVKLWENLKRFKPDTWVSSWMRTIFKNLVKDNFKAHSSLNFSQMSARHDEAETFEDWLISDENLSQEFSTSWEYDTIMQAIDKLEWEYKEVIFLKFVEEKWYDEIANIIWSSEANVRQKVSRGLKKLKVFLS